MLRSLFLMACCFAVIRCTVGETLAQGDADRQNQQVTDAQRDLLQRLGDPSFAEREQAQATLLKQGLDAEPALLEALKYPDVEIRSRARYMLQKIRRDAFEARLAAFIADTDGKQQHKLPGWKAFRELVGDSPKAREIFVGMTRHDKALLSAFERQSAEMPKLYSDHVTWVQSLARTGYAEGTIDSRPLLATILLIGGDDQIKHSSNQMLQLHQLLSDSRSAQAFGTEAQTTVLRTLLARFVDKTDSNTSYYSMSLAQKYDLKEVGMRQARKRLEGKQTTSSSLARYAIINVGRFGGKEDAPLLTPWLDDKTICNRWSNRAIKKNGTIDTQIRDVALAVLLRLHGKDPKQHGFKLLQENRETLYHSYTFGFVENEEREAVHAKWAAEFKTDKD